MTTRVTGLEVAMGAPPNVIKSATNMTLLGVLFVATMIAAATLYFAIQGAALPNAPRTFIETQELLLDQAVNKAPSSGQAWADFIKTKTSLGDYETAQTAVERGRKLVKGDQRIYIDLAAVNLLLTQKRFREADKLADAVIAEDKEFRAEAMKKLSAKGVVPKMSEVSADMAIKARVTKARTAAALKKWAIAIEVLTEAIELSPQSSDLLAMRGDAHLRLGNAESAEADFRKALEYTPDYGPALNGLRKVVN